MNTKHTPEQINQMINERAEFKGKAKRLEEELAEFREQHNFEWVETNTKLAWLRNTIAELRTERKWLRSEVASLNSSYDQCKKANDTYLDKWSDESIEANALISELKEELNMKNLELSNYDKVSRHAAATIEDQTALAVHYKSLWLEANIELKEESKEHNRLKEKYKRLFEYEI
tara:strand:+ start:449 stop:970 length:522 start_codon:yes stop_codon:yes gene_type:complete